MSSIPRPGGVLRVMSLNAWFRPPLELRLVEMAAWIGRLEPHVVCLQEVRRVKGEPTLAERVASARRESWHVAYDGLANGDGVESGNAVLSRWPVEVRGVVRLEGREPLPKLVLGVRTLGLDLFSVHLSSDPAGAGLRERQVLALACLVSDSEGSGSVLPPIVAGDFNSSPGASAIRFLRGECSLEGQSAFFQDAWGVAGRGLGLTWSRENPHVPPAFLFEARCDYIFVGRPRVPLGWSGGEDPAVPPVGQVVGAQLGCHESLTGCFASDHFAVVADIVWPDVPTA